jgi:hypothetical protein
MPEPRLATHMMVASLLRRTQAVGGFATLLAKGDETAGTLLIIGQIRGENPRLFERFHGLESGALWEEIPNQITDKYENISNYLNRRRHNDPDLWILELDVASDERLAELIGEKA